jgi:wyosine [tRNA(Phe)-imidazoG37] synthetase (radical SAM superfamily)
MIGNPSVFSALQKLDQNILKLDAGFDHMFNLINNPVDPVTLVDLVDNLKKFHGKLVIQSMFLRGNFKGQRVDNTTPAEVDEWIRLLKEIDPQMVMIYPIARATPLHDLEKIGQDELEKIAGIAREAGLIVKVY